MRFLHTADWQIGMTRHYLDAEAQARFGAARIDAIRRIGAVAHEQGCEFVVVCGDVFETNQLSRQTVGRALEALASIPVPVYLLPGNHDPLDPVTIYRSHQFVRDCPENVHVLQATEPMTVRPGVQLIPAPWSGKHPDHDLVAEAVQSALPGGMPSAGEAEPLRVVVGHGAVDVLDPDRANASTIALAPLEREIEAGRLHYVALGDRHSRTQVGSSGAVWYAGAPEPTSHREDQPGQVLVVDIEHDAPPVVTPHQVGTWSFHTLRRELHDDASVQALAKELSAIPDKDRAVVRLALRGALDVAAYAALGDLLAEQAEIFAALHTWERHTHLQVSAGDADALALGGFLGAAARDLQELARSADTVPAKGADQDEEDWETDPVAAEQPRDTKEDLLTWAFSSDAEPDAHSATEALALLHRLTREVAR